MPIFRRILPIAGFAFLLEAGVWLESTRASEPSVISATTERPVVHELLGGCSLTCSFPWTATAGEVRSALAALNDADAFTAWTEARVGDRLVFKFPADLPRELNGTPFYGVDIANGRQQPAEGFKEHGRIKTLKLYHNDRAVHEFRLADSRRWQKVEFPDIYLNVGDTLALEIVEIYPGKSGETAAMTEIVLQGAH